MKKSETCLAFQYELKALRRNKRKLSQATNRRRDPRNYRSVTLDD